MSIYKKFLSDTAIYGISTVASRVLNFFLTPIYVRVYPANLYGIFTEMYSFASILNAILSFGMETTFFRYLNKKETNKDEIYNNTFLVIAFISLLFGIVCITFLNDIAEWMQKGRATSILDYKIFISLFITILITDALSVVPFAKLRAEGKSARYSILKTTNILVFIFFNVFFLFIVPYIQTHFVKSSTFINSWYVPKWIGYVFISNLIASLFTLICLIPELRQVKLKLNQGLVLQMFNYSWPVLIANISFIINENSDKIFLTHLLPKEHSLTQVGIYGACCKIAIFLSIFIQAFRLGAEPFFFNHSKNPNSAKTYALIMDYFVIAVSIILVALVANIEILKLFIKAKDVTQRNLYWSGLSVVPILLLGYACLGIYMNLSVWYKLSDQTKYGLYISGFGAIITIVLNIIFIPIYGFMASAIISLIAYASMMLLSYFLGQKHYPIPYHVFKNVCYLTIAILLVIITFIVFNRNLIIGNTLLFIFIIGTCFIEKKNIKQITHVS